MIRGWKCWAWFAVGGAIPVGSVVFMAFKDPEYAYWALGLFALVVSFYFLFLREHPMDRELRKLEEAEDGTR